MKINVGPLFAEKLADQIDKDSQFLEVLSQLFLFLLSDLLLYFSPLYAKNEAKELFVDRKMGSSIIAC